MLNDSSNKACFLFLNCIFFIIFTKGKTQQKLQSWIQQFTFCALVLSFSFTKNIHIYKKSPKLAITFPSEDSAFPGTCSPGQWAVESLPLLRPVSPASVAAPRGTRWGVPPSDDRSTQLSVAAVRPFVLASGTWRPSLVPHDWCPAAWPRSRTVLGPGNRGLSAALHDDSLASLGQSFAVHPKGFG